MAAKPTTDRARFHRVIARLQAEGFYYANACCQSCGFAEADKAGAVDIVSINDQSSGRAFYGDAGRTPAKRLPATMVMPLYVAYNGRAQRIVEVFREEGFNVETYRHRYVLSIPADTRTLTRPRPPGYCRPAPYARPDPLEARHEVSPMRVCGPQVAQCSLNIRQSARQFRRPFR